MLFGADDEGRFSEAEIEAAERATSEGTTPGDAVAEADGESDGDDNDGDSDDGDGTEPSTEPTPDPSVAEILDAVADDPASVEGADSETLSGIRRHLDGEERAAATLAVLADTDSGAEALAPHADELLAHLGTEEAGEYVCEVLCVLARHDAVPVDALFDTLEGGSTPAKNGAALVLGTVAVTRADDVPVDRLESLYDGDDAATRGGAGYVLALLAAERPDDVDVPEPTPEGFVELAGRVVDAGVAPFVASELQQEAMVLVAADVLPVDVAGLDVAKTPMGTQVVVETSSPAEAVGPGGENVQALTTALEERLGLDDPQIDVQEPGE